MQTTRREKITWMLGAVVVVILIGGFCYLAFTRAPSASSTQSSLGLATSARAVYEFTPAPVPRLASLDAALPRHGMVSFNFDDGFASTYRIAIPILNGAGFKSTQYIISGYFKTPGYVNASQVLDMQAQGHEIGAHTRTHPHLTTLSPAQLKDEIFGSRGDLLNIGVKQVNTFAYPYGYYNAAVEEAARQAGFLDARTTEPLLNDMSTDRFLLKRQRVQADVALDEVEKAIDEASTGNKWIILVFHRVDEDGNVESVRPEVLQQIVAYVQTKKMPVVTMEEGIGLVSSMK